jgi:hypothetical protein
MLDIRVEGAALPLGNLLRRRLLARSAEAAESTE